ncbi:Transcription factor [Coemansia sp. RSA 1200]|nr:Transcription factor [Coemansia sp. RSA 1200]
MTTHKRRTSKLELEPNPFEQSFSRVRSSENIAESLLERSTESPSLSSSLRSGGNNGASPASLASAKRESGPWRKREEDESAGRTAIITTNTASSYEPPLSTSSGSSSASKQGHQQRPITLPPVTAINTPLHASKIGEAWGPESLRSGPLSPAMLGGPASSSSAYKPLAARTTPRLGMSDPALHTGLTPFITGEAHPSSGIGITAAPFENNNSTSLITTPGLQAVIRATIEGKDIMATPGGSLHIAPSQKNHQHHHYQTADNNSSSTSRPQQAVGAAVYGPVVPGAHSAAVSASASAGMPSLLDASQTATNAAIAAAVSSAYSAAPIAATQQQQQSYHGLNKQGVLWPMAVAGGGVFGEGGGGVERSSASAQNYELKRSAAHMLSGDEERSDTSVLQVSAGVAHQSRSQSQSQSQSLPPSHAKRARSINSNSSKSRTALGGANAAASEDLDAFSGNGNVKSEAAASASKRGGRAATKEETRGNNNNSASKSPSPSQVAPDAEEDEKRRQFLERNRIAALKCRQRKKKQIQELQGRHDYVVLENKRLYADYMKLREEALHMRALLVAHRECSVAKASGVFGTDNLPIGMASLSLQQPLLFGSGFESEQAKDIIAAIPPASNGVPVHSIDPATGHPINVNVLPQ